LRKQHLIVRILLSALTFCICAPAANLQSWNGVDAGLYASNRLRWWATASVRFRDHWHEAYDSYLGSMARVALNRRWSVTAGYLFRQVNPDHAAFRNEHRLVASPAVFLSPERTRVEAAVQFERLRPIDRAPAFNRYRPRVVIERVRKGLSPFLATEGLFFKEQFHRSRNMAGLRWRFDHGSMLEMGYQFEILRNGAAWIPRHALRSTVVLGDLRHLRQAD